MPQKQHNWGPSVSPHQNPLEAWFNVEQEQPSPPANTEIAAICLKANQFTHFFSTDQKLSNFL